MTRPLVGITSYVDRARWSTWDREATLLPQAYVTAVHQAGGRALVVPPSPDGAAEVVAALDGLILAGGADIDPALYGAEPEAWTTDLRPDRDGGEVPLLRAAIGADLPVLGVCRGMQLMVAVAGGRLVQHLPDVLGSDRHRAGQGSYARHGVRTEPGSRLAGLVGEQIEVPSYHHQGVDDPGALTVSAYADDGTIEGVEVPDARFRVGILWHPEQDVDGRLFEGLVAAAR